MASYIALPYIVGQNEPSMPLSKLATAADREELATKGRQLLLECFYTNHVTGKIYDDPEMLPENTPLSDAWPEYGDFAVTNGPTTPEQIGDGDYVIFFTRLDD